jgi:hypothetical protein
LAPGWGSLPDLFCSERKSWHDLSGEANKTVSHSALQKTFASALEKSPVNFFSMVGLIAKKIVKTLL